MTCPKCYHDKHLEGARFCMNCGASLESCEGCVNEEKDRDMDCCYLCARNRKNTRIDLFRRSEV